MNGRIDSGRIDALLSNGVYYIRVISGDTASNGKLIILK